MILIRDFLADQKILISPDANPSPTVSVVLPTYRRFKEGFLERSIKSVLAQKFEDFELLVIDDGSTDGSYDLVENFRARDPRVIHVRHEQNSGIHTVRLNEGIDLARGKYIAFQFDDDLWRENALQDLVGEIQRHAEPVLVLGRALFHGKLGQGILPRQPVDIVSLYEINRFANNSVLFPRSLVETYGMYDPHIGMRRLCDWDLWLRLIKHIPFITLDEVISEVFEGNVGAIGVTVPWDMALFRYLHSIPRDHLLTPEQWQDYPVDSLTIGDVVLTGEHRRRLYEEQIVPYYFKFRHVFPWVGGFTATYQDVNPKTVLYTKQSYDVCNEVTVTHYDALANQRGSFKSYYQVLGEVKSEWPLEADQLLLVRTVEDDALDLADQALKSNRPVGLYLDDDLFTFHEYGPEFNYLAPGKPFYQNLSELAGQVDAVLVTNEFIARSVRRFTPRLIPHNNTVPDSALPVDIQPRHTSQLRIGYAGSGYRIDEFRLLWDAFQRIAQEYGDRVCFEFWGIDISILPPLASPVVQKPFTFSYPYYLEELKKSGFDIMLTPLLDQPRPRLGKSLIKYYETAVAGALGIFSDTPQYQALPAGLTCIKAANDAESWYQALKTAIEMRPDEFDCMRRRCLQHVREEYSVSAQIDLHEAALRAVEFHARTRGNRHSDGCPRVMYVLHSAHYGGGEIQLLRRLRLVKRYGIQPVVVIPSVVKDTEHGQRLKDALALDGIQLESAVYMCFTEPHSPQEYFSEMEREQIRLLLERCAPALVHTVTFIPSFGQVCQEVGIPHVSTQYAIIDEFAWNGERPDFAHCALVQSDTVRYTNRWADLLGVEKLCSRDMAPESLFRLGQTTSLNAIGQTPPSIQGRPVRLVTTGTFQERKQQLETIEAVGRLKKKGVDLQLTFYGYTHFFPDYMQKCHQAIKDWNLEDCVSILEFSEDLDRILSQADLLLSLSTFESFPGSLKDAMAAGVLVVATPVGGIPELIIDSVSGILCTSTSVEDLVQGIERALALAPEARQKIVEQARRVAILELHPRRTANDLFRMYNRAIEITVGGKPVLARPAGASAPRLERYARARIKAPASPPASLMPIGAGVVYTVTPDQDSWSGIDVLFETNARTVTGQLILQVLTPGGDVLRTSVREVNNLREASWLDLRFPPVKNAAGQSFRLVLKFYSTPPGALVSLYQSSPARRREIRAAYRLLRKAGRRLPGGRLHCQLWYDQE